MIETQADDVSAYIPTNVISITDGQIFLKSDLFYSGVRPAINAGISVSRVGGNAQRRAMRKVAGRLRLDLAAYRELEAFSQFASELDAATQRQLSRGQRLVATLNQPQYQPWPLEEQVTAIWAATNGYLDDVPVAQVPRFHEELRQSLRAEGTILKTIDESGDLSDETLEALKKAVDGFKEGFYVEEERGLAAARRIARGQDSRTSGGGSGSAQNVEKITKAMELVAASRLRRAQARIEALRPYADRMQALTVEVAAATSRCARPAAPRAARRLDRGRDRAHGRPRARRRVQRQRRAP